MIIRLSIALGLTAVYCFAAGCAAPAATPEPSTMLLVGGGIAGAIEIAKRRSSRK